MRQQVFISYSRRDGVDYAEKLQQHLEAAGFGTWRDTRNINPAQDFTAEIEMGIKRADVVALCLTPDTLRDNSFVRREIQYALALKRPIFPCIMEKDVVPHNWIKSVHMRCLAPFWKPINPLVVSSHGVNLC